MQIEAARSLADMARDSMRRELDGALHKMSIEVRDEKGPVLQVRLTFEIERPEH